MLWRCRDRVFDLAERTLVMGVVNVTPDSFSDGGLFAGHEAAIRQGERMAEEGADILDIGGESTRPGHAPVSEEEEKRRVLPVVECLARRLALPITCGFTSKAGRMQQWRERTLRGRRQCLRQDSRVRWRPRALRRGKSIPKTDCSGT